MCGLRNHLHFGEKSKYHLAHEVLFDHQHKDVMRKLILPLLPLLFAASLLLAQPQPQSGGQKQQKDSKSQAKGGTSMTGCVDEQDSHYVLIDVRDRSTIANLEADGFPTEGFAKHMGHKVTIRGISSPGGTIPLIKVRSIETVSDTCQLQQEQ